MGTAIAVAAIIACIWVALIAVTVAANYFLHGHDPSDHTFERSAYIDRNRATFEHSPYGDHRRPDRDQVMPVRHVCDGSHEHATGWEALQHVLNEHPYNHEQDTK